MKHSLQTLRKSEQGFTLVELAVVMIIIGILIGGILKGQELITNSRVTATTSQLEAISAAKNDFQNQYNAIPGDMRDAAARIGQCGAAVCVNGDGDGIIDVNVGAAPAAANEDVQFFRDLVGSGYLTGLDGTNQAVFGQGLPTAAIGGGFTVGDTRTGVTSFTTANMRAGQYLVQTGQAAAVGANTGVMTGLQASRIDTKLDDGVPNRGGLQGDTAGCIVANAYTAVANATCSIAYRI